MAFAELRTETDRTITWPSLTRPPFDRLVSTEDSNNLSDNSVEKIKFMLAEITRINSTWVVCLFSNCCSNLRKNTAEVRRFASTT